MADNPVIASVAATNCRVWAESKFLQSKLWVQRERKKLSSDKPWHDSSLH